MKLVVNEFFFVTNCIKYRIFVLQIWGIAYTRAIPLCFAPFFMKKRLDLVEIPRRLF